jgi:hypothetical protein
MHIVQRVPRRVQRKMYLASERQVVNGVGLGDLEGMFNIGKMFTRMFHFTPRSFQLKNIAGAIGSVALTGATLGLAPKISSAHSKVAKIVGYAEMAAAAVVGGVIAAPMIGGALGIGGVAATGTGLTVGAEAAAGTVAASGGIMSTIGSGIMSVGSGLMTAMQALPVIGQLMGGGGSPQQQQGGMTQAEYDAMQAQAQIQAQQQAAYDAQVRGQQNQMYLPGGYRPSIPFVGDQYSGAVASAPSSGAYGDLRTPYTAIQEDGTQVQVNPATGQIIQAGMIPDLSPTTWLAIGGATLIGWYVMSGSKSNN